jgi:hypothetical protein
MCVSNRWHNHGNVSHVFYGWLSVQKDAFIAGIEVVPVAPARVELYEGEGYELVFQKPSGCG